MASTYLTHTTSTPTNSDKATLSFWLKRSLLSSGRGVFAEDTNGTNKFAFILASNDTINIFQETAGTVDINLVTNRVFRDISAWYHIVIAYDSSQGSASDRVKLYVNGSQETSFSTSTYPSSNVDFRFNKSGIAQEIGRYEGGNYFDGLLSHINFIDGTAYDADTFGETDSTTGIWKPKTAPSVTYGTNGFFLKFENSAAFGTDSSGNGNTFTVNGTMTQTIDTPSNVFATMNPLNRHVTPILYKNGNTVIYDTTGNFNTAFSTLGISSGKYYFEAKTSTDNGFVGICQTDGIYPAETNGVYLGHSNLGTASWGYYADSGTYFHNGSATAYGDSWTNTDVIGCALDLDNNKLYFSKNGVWQNSGDPTSGATGTGAISITASSYFFGVTKDTESSEMQSNFGNGYFGTTAVSSAQNPDDGIGIFEYDVPAGYRALNTKAINAEEYS